MYVLNDMAPIKTGRQLTSTFEVKLLTTSGTSIVDFRLNCLKVMLANRRPNLYEFSHIA